MASSPCSGRPQAGIPAEGVLPLIADLVPNDEQSALGATRGALITDVFEGQGLAELTPKSARITAVDFQHVDAR
ncbi:hypothetical protein SVIOM74S_07416 [Streptomyces violarus]